MLGGPDDFSLIDALARMRLQRYQGTLWRITREGRDPTCFFAGGNRWDDGAFEVLYASLSSTDALAELQGQLLHGQSVVPSKIDFRLHELEIRIDGVLDLTDVTLLLKLGIHKETYGEMPSLTREGGYEACQLIGEEAYTLGSEDSTDISAILVPSAFHSGSNIVVFGDFCGSDAIRHVKDHGSVDLTFP